MGHKSKSLTARLLADGYCVIPDAVSARTVELLDRDCARRFAATPFCEGGFYGMRTKRFGALLRRSAHAAALVTNPLVLSIVKSVLKPWCDRIALNLTQAVEIHPGALAQIPHRDQDLWGGAKGIIEYQVNAVWPMTRFRAENGATLVWLNSHRPDAPADQLAEAIPVGMEPGSVLLFLGSTLHGGGANRTELPRRAMIVGYCLGWLRTFENQYLVYPPTVARSFEPDLAELVGYAQHRPNLGNVEGQCPSVLFDRADLDGLPAIDALRSDQAEELERYVAEQEAARVGLTGG